MSSDTARPFVVIESSRTAASDALVASLVREGFDVATCAGPRNVGDCPLVTTTDCHLVERADAVIHDLDLDDPVDRDVLWMLRSRYPELQVIVETSTDNARRHQDDLAGCIVVPPYSPDHLAEVVAEVVAQR
jgi:DNA-binding NarL/FixJ family response regulator